MIVEAIEASTLRIPFRRAFRHAAAARDATQAVWVEARARDGTVGRGEGCPREYVTAETLAGAIAFIETHAADWRTSIHDPVALSAWVARHREDIDRHPAAWTAVELALLDLFGKAEGRTLESLLGLPPLAGTFRYTAVLGDAAPDAFAAQLAAYREAGFRDFKIKLSGKTGRDRSKVAALVAAGIAPASVRADANNAWPDADTAIRGLTALDFPFRAVEEPLRYRDFDGMRRVSRALGTKIILDESLLGVGQLDAIGRDRERWIANVRVSKMGGLLRALEFGRAARRCGVPIIVGAHVGETTVLTRAGIALASGLGAGVVAQEGAFGTHLLRYEPVEPPLMFGAAGILDAAALGIAGVPGLGLTVQ